MYYLLVCTTLKTQKSAGRTFVVLKNFLVVTNTKFTSTAEQYAACSGVTLLSWDYQKDNNLHDRIQRSGVYPVTVLQTLSNTQKKPGQNGIITCRNLLDKPFATDPVSQQRHEKC